MPRCPADWLLAFVFVWWLTVERLTVNKQQITEQMAELRKSIDKECGKIKVRVLGTAVSTIPYT